MSSRLLHTTFIVCMLLIISACQNNTVDLDNLVGQDYNSIEVGLENKDNINVLDASRHEGEPTEDGEAVIVPDPNAIDVIVNKDRRLPEGYEPPDLMVPDVDFHVVAEERMYMREEAAHALEELFEGASEDGYELYAISGYRSEQTQEVVFASNVDRHGEEHAEQYSAQPGHSEHQTGLAMDVSAESFSLRLGEGFSDTPEGEWVADNSHHYGFIVRYLEGKSDITGYNYEPWHLRYVGEELATSIYESGLTMEEYFGLVD
ncbi:M15 family metallopeptidase [Alkalibacillus haloalkaliphilus]|uniref:D-alanyl-D-alanine carboxypeptidase-like core domain-containing protein n=1 Tax=Alkalibacillus haloalkaliphilus TaxID=94136 RepID=A0A511W3W7_9BACI|nr:M15 family metallopeptidase [Alkalibacillus haloalkaliphilus]GEN45770.1 hypothetical protein AHA02nite_15460 [Alkalibacillus haloalkaliphilus]